MGAPAHNAQIHERIAPAVVVVERDSLMRALLMEWLAREGYAVHAWDGATEKPLLDPSLVIVDVYRPRRDGTSRMRAVQSAFPGAPVIAISGQFQPGLCGAGTTARELGVRQVIAKPFHREQLIAAVRDVAGPADD